ncbi:ectonucleotide pyrophosphatase/phosphodiesterase [Phenylobacterium deserti]|uniref:Alkaline phosphatase family protein n=1 Tax=Phenylobacterium deserti TaxID=1914756 RepID=A0A328ACF4_9CAUL|nr:ectonucleotide pyrophosphatase/phosphodiesterase [Phenylobacterium deserti]RAK51054.1 alkaline phosphatase family protein [Phenylobacterium deserti]
MSNPLRMLLALCAVLAFAGCASRPPSAPAHVSHVRQVAPTILVSIDGFRPDYLDRGLTPAMSRLAQGGVLAAMRPSFPSKTFPNHWTLVTGLRPDRHGMVDNNMEDAAIPGVKFSLSNKAAVADPRWWGNAAPLWVSAERQGVRTATMFWPGSDTVIQGVRPSQWRLYDEDVTPTARVDQVLAWLDLPPAERPRFLTLYFEEVDTAGHHFGPTSPEVNRAIANTDAAIARLVEGLRARGLGANLVIVSDHGMASTSPDRRIWLDDLLPAGALRQMTAGAFLSAFPQPGFETQVDKALIQPHAHMQCWRKAEIPARYLYGKHSRVPPYFCLPDTGWEITTRAYAATHRTDHGNHGYDPFAPEMRALFLAKGPGFRRGARPPVFDNVDVYPVLARLAGVRPEPNDGDLRELGPTLAP